jgi:hypothetical protein
MTMMMKKKRMNQRMLLKKRLSLECLINYDEGIHAEAIDLNTALKIDCHDFVC